jgi:hypothetical protein
MHNGKIASSLHPMSVDLRLWATDAAKRFAPPQAVIDLSLADQLFSTYGGENPDYGKFMELSEVGSLADFRSYPTGTTVCYHMIVGCKVFVLVKPTDNNRRLVAEYNADTNRKR